MMYWPGEEGCLSFIMHKVQDAGDMQTECWNLSLVNLFKFMSNHYTSLRVSFDSFIGSDACFKGGTNREWGENTLSLLWMQGQWKSDQIFEHIPLRSGDYESSSFRLP